MALDHAMYRIAELQGKPASHSRNGCDMGLFSHGLNEKNEGEAHREIKLTITYFRDTGALTRAFFGVLSGKDGLDVKVEVVNRKDKKIVGSANVSNYNISAVDFSEKGMIEAVSA